MTTPRSPSALGWFFAMRSAQSRRKSNEPMRFSSMTARKSSRGCGPSFASVRLAMPPPAVLTPTCKAPNRSTTVSSARAMLSLSRTSSGWKKEPPPIDDATSSPALFGRSRIATFAPRAANSSAVARAMPDAPPAIAAASPLISTLCSPFFSDFLCTRSQHVFAHLARRHARQLVDRDEVFRKLLTGKTRALEKPADLREVDALPRPEHDEGTSLLAGRAARHGDDRHVGHRLVGREHVLDLLRTDVLARADDDVLLPSRDHQIALVHATPEVAHAKVALVVEGGGIVLGMHVADELLGAAHQDLALLA